MSKRTPKENPYLRNVGRAAYELPILLQQLPSDLYDAEPLSPDALLIAKAASKHLYSARVSVLSGLEALGRVMASAAQNSDDKVDDADFYNLGYLISHLAVEAQWLWDTQDELEHALRKKGQP